MKLYEVDATLTLLLDKRDAVLEASQGEVTEEFEQADADLRAYLAASVDKIEAALVIVQSLESDAETIKVEEKRLADRRRSLENNSDRLRNIVASVLDAAFNGKVKTPKFTASVSVSAPAIDVMASPDADLVKLAEEYPDFVSLEPKISKANIKAALKAGTKLPAGFFVVEMPAKRSLRIR